MKKYKVIFYDYGQEVDSREFETDEDAHSFVTTEYLEICAYYDREVEEIEQ